METMLIGIAGGTGSGKTTITNRIKNEFGDDVSVIFHDSYYRSNDDKPFEQRISLNYDHPDAFETELLVEHLIKLKSGEEIECPVYDYSLHTRAAETMIIKPAKVIVLEGILVLSDPRLCNLMDIKIFVDTDADVRILRRILRDVKKRGRSMESVISQYLATVKPMHEQFVEPSRRQADIIVPEGGRNEVALEMIFHRVATHIAEN